jgi:hypothetical protein
MASDTSIAKVGKIRQHTLLRPNNRRHEIAVQNLEAYLRTAVPEISLPLQVDQFTYGQVRI